MTCIRLHPLHLTPLRLQLQEAAAPARGHSPQRGGACRRVAIDGTFGIRHMAKGEPTDHGQGRESA